MFRQHLSPHQLGLADVLATLTLIGQAPASLTLIGVVPQNLDLGMELSAAMAPAIDRAVACLTEELRRLGLEPAPRPSAAAAPA